MHPCILINNKIWKIECFCLINIDGYKLVILLLIEYNVMIILYDNNYLTISSRQDCYLIDSHVRISLNNYAILILNIYRGFRTHDSTNHHILILLGT